MSAEVRAGFIGNRGETVPNQASLVKVQQGLPASSVTVVVTFTNRSLRRCCVPLIALTLLCACTAAPSPSGPELERAQPRSSDTPPDPTPNVRDYDVVWGGGVSLEWWGTNDDTEEVLGMLHQLGMGRIRLNLRWHLLETEPSQYQWEHIDRVMLEAARTDVEVLAILAYAPPWANAGGEPHAGPVDLASFADFATQVAARYGRDGELWQTNPELTQRPLTAVEVWNEPWHQSYLLPPDADWYAAAVRAVAGAVRSVDPTVLIVASGDGEPIRDGSRRPWIEVLLEADPGLVEVVDVWSIHLYAQAARGPDDAAATVRELLQLASRALSGRRIWVTEIGADATALAERDGGDGRGLQARELMSMLDAVLAGGTVERVYLFSISRPRAGGGLPEGWHLLDVRGRPQPALTAVASLISRP
jgi:hypothetical protein